MKNTRYKQNYHIQINQNLNALAYRAITLGGTVYRDSTEIEYDVETNTLYIFDGLTLEMYHPYIDNSRVDPFAKRIKLEY